jgi:hypothetical protein
MKQTAEGITTEHTDVPLNARDSIRFKLEFDSNESDENRQFEKHFEQRISTLRGITID